MFTNKNLVRLTGLLVMASLALAACGGASDNAGDTTGGTGTTGGANAPVAAKAPVVGGEVVYHNQADPDTYAYFWRTSAYAANILDVVYAGGLVGVGYDYKPKAAMAEALPEVTNDGKTYTFKLKKGIKFHDGHEVTAEDFVFTYETLMNPDYQGPFKTNIAEIAEVKALDEWTIQFTTKDVFAPFLFSSAGLPPMPKHILGAVPVKDLQGSDLWKSPVGTGPYKFVEAKSGQYVLLERFADYYMAGKDGEAGGKVGPFVEKLRYKTIPDDNTAMAGFEAGEVSMITGIEGDNADRLMNEYAKEGKVQGFEWNRMGYGFQTFNNDKFPTNIKEVRQALSHGLNRQQIVDGLLNGQGSVPPGFVPPIHWTFDKTIKGYPYDVQKATELMEKAGFKKNAAGIYEKDGQPAKLKYVATKGSALVEGMALASQKDWKQIGFDVEVLTVDFNTLLDKHMKPGDFHVTSSGVSFTIDPHVSFSRFHSGNIRLDDKGVAQGSNTARFKNAKIDELIDKGMKTVDVAERLKIYQEAQRLIVDEAPANWIYVNRWFDFAQNDVQGLVNWDGFGLDLGYVDQWSIAAK